MGGKKEIYRDVWFFHGALQLFSFLHLHKRRLRNCWQVKISSLTINVFITTKDWCHQSCKQLPQMQPMHMLRHAHVNQPVGLFLSTWGHSWYHKWLRRWQQVVWYVASPRTWNKLPAYMCLIEDLEYFRKLLKARLFDWGCGT